MRFKKTILTGACILAVSVFILSTPSCERDGEEIEKPVTEETVKTPVPASSVSFEYDPEAEIAKVTVSNDTEYSTEVEYVGYLVFPDMVPLEDMNRDNYPPDAFTAAGLDMPFTLDQGEASVSFDVAASESDYIMVFQSFSFSGPGPEAYSGKAGGWYQFWPEDPDFLFNVDVKQLFKKPQDNFEIVVEGDWTNCGNPVIINAPGWTMGKPSYDGKKYTTFVFSGKGIPEDPNTWIHFGIWRITPGPGVPSGKCVVKKLYWTKSPGP